MTYLVSCRNQKSVISLSRTLKNYLYSKGNLEKADFRGHRFQTIDGNQYIFHNIHYPQQADGLRYDWVMSDQLLEKRIKKEEV